MCVRTARLLAEAPDDDGTAHLCLQVVQVGRIHEVEQRLTSVESLLYLPAIGQHLRLGVGPPTSCRNRSSGHGHGQVGRPRSSLVAAAVLGVPSEREGRAVTCVSVSRCH